MKIQEAVIISAYTGILCCRFSDFHKYVEGKFGHPVFTHEMASEKFFEKLKELSEPDFLKICEDLE